MRVFKRTLGIACIAHMCISLSIILHINMLNIYMMNCRQNIATQRNMIGDFHQLRIGPVMYISKKPKERTANCSIWRSRAQQNLMKISNHPPSNCLDNLIFFFLPSNFPGCLSHMSMMDNMHCNPIHSPMSPVSFAAMGISYVPVQIYYRWSNTFYSAWLYVDSYPDTKYTIPSHNLKDFKA
jgi:hypothetical protein